MNKQAQPKGYGTFFSRVLRIALSARGFQFIAVAFSIALLAAVLPTLGTPLVTIALCAAGLFFLAIIYVIFSWLLSARASHRSKLSLMLAYTVTAVAAAGTLLIFASVFFNWPLPIRSLIVAKMDSAPRFDLHRIFSELKIGSGIAAAEAIIGPPFYYDENLRRYKLRGGELEVVLIPHGGIIRSSYVEWRGKPTVPLPIMDSPFGDFSEDDLRLGKATFGSIKRSLPLECGDVYGDSYQNVFYAAIDCKLGIGWKDPYYISLGVNDIHQIGKSYHEIKDISEIDDVVVEFIAITMTEEEDANPVAVAQDLRAYGGE